MSCNRLKSAIFLLVLAAFCTCCGDLEALLGEDDECLENIDGRLVPCDEDPVEAASDQTAVTAQSASPIYESSGESAQEAHGSSEFTIEVSARSPSLDVPDLTERLSPMQVEPICVGGAVRVASWSFNTENTIQFSLLIPDETDCLDIDREGAFCSLVYPLDDDGDGAHVHFLLNTFHNGVQTYLTTYGTVTVRDNHLVLDQVRMSRYDPIGGSTGSFELQGQLPLNRSMVIEGDPGGC